MTAIKNVETITLLKTAIQWNQENKTKVLEFLKNNDIGYSFHEIYSAGELILYTGVGPLQVPVGFWIIFDATNKVVSCESNEAFYLTFKILEEENEDPTE